MFNALVFLAIVGIIVFLRALYMWIKRTDYITEEWSIKVDTRIEELEEKFKILEKKRSK